MDPKISACIVPSIARLLHDRCDFQYIVSVSLSIMISNFYICYILYNPSYGFVAVIVMVGFTGTVWL